MEEGTSIGLMLLGAHATWATVGTLMYDEGIAAIKAPTIPRFGKNNFQVDMRGQQNIFSLRISVPAPAGNLGLSTNPTFKSLAPTDFAIRSKIRNLHT